MLPFESQTNVMALAITKKDTQFPSSFFSHEPAVSSRYPVCPYCSAVKQNALCALRLCDLRSELDSPYEVNVYGSSPSIVLITWHMDPASYQVFYPSNLFVLDLCFGHHLREHPTHNMFTINPILHRRVCFSINNN